jgi:hypothetical protein
MINKMIRKTTPAVKKIENNGITGANALWDGPLDVSGFPMGTGSSSGKNGMQVNKLGVKYDSAPITQRAKCKL